MDFQLEPLLGDNVTDPYTEPSVAPATRRPGEVRFLCSGCSSVVARDVPIPGIRKRVFHCSSCGARSVVGWSTLRR